MSYTISSAIKFKAESNDRAYNLDFQPILANILSPYTSSFSLTIPPLGGEVLLENLTLESGKYPTSVIAIQAQRPFDVSISLDRTDPLNPISIYSGNYSLIYISQLADIQTGINLRFAKLDQIKIKSHPLVDTAFMCTAFIGHGSLV